MAYFNAAAALQIRAERKAGVLLAATDGLGAKGGDRKSSNSVLLDAIVPLAIGGQRTGGRGGKPLRGNR